jgi:hypothetical protein
MEWGVLTCQVQEKTPTHTSMHGEKQMNSNYSGNYRQIWFFTSDMPSTGPSHYEHVEDNYGNLRNDDQIIYRAINADEPPGKSLDKPHLISIILTISNYEDATLLISIGISG